MIEELAGRVMHAHSEAVKHHWATKSYAAHMALGGFYANVMPLLDDLIEAYQGMLVDIDPFDVPAEPVDDIRQFLRDEMDWIEANRDELAADSAHIGNLIDNLTALYSKTVYLLGLQ